MRIYLEVKQKWLTSINHKTEKIYLSKVLLGILSIFRQNKFNENAFYTNRKIRNDIIHSQFDECKIK